MFKQIRKRKKEKRQIKKSIYDFFDNSRNGNNDFHKVLKKMMKKEISSQFEIETDKEKKNFLTYIEQLTNEILIENNMEIKEDNLNDITIDKEFDTEISEIINGLSNEIATMKLKFIDTIKGIDDNINILLDERSTKIKLFNMKMENISEIVKK